MFAKLKKYINYLHALIYIVSLIYILKQIYRKYYKYKI